MNLHNKVDLLLDRALERWARVVIFHPWICLGLIICLAGASLTYTFSNLGINTDTTDLLSADLPFRQNGIRLENAFPQDSRAILAVVRGSYPEQTRQAVRSLRKLYQAQTTDVESVYTPESSPYFERQALLYLDTKVLEKMAMDITRAQPFLGRMARNNTFAELLGLTGQAIEQKDDALQMELNQLTSRISTAVDNVLQGNGKRISWQNLITTNQSAQASPFGFVLVKPVFDFSDLIPAEKAFKVVRNISRKYELQHPGVSVRLTGEVALEHEEMESVSQGMGIAGVVSLVLVCTALLWGLHSASLAIATLVALIIGLILSAGFATLAVGHLNLISIAFAVLYVGLGVDYAIHISLRFEDYINSNIPTEEAVLRSIRSVGPSIILCTLTTSVGFYAFVPTAYQGVSELGIISGTAMFIGLFVTLTLLPALLVTLPIKLKPLKTTESKSANECSLPIRHAKLIRFGSFLIALVGLWVLTQVSFDFDPISLRNQQTESVTTFRELLKEKEYSPLAISVLASNRQDAVEKTLKLERLAVVDNVLSIVDFIPIDQDEKLDIIVELDESLGSSLANFPSPGKVDVSEQSNSISKLLSVINNRLQSDLTESVRQSLLTLQRQLEKLAIQLRVANSDEQNSLLTAVQNNLLATLPETIASLSVALQAIPITQISQLPVDLRKRWISRDGVHRLWVTPKKDLNELENLKEFVSEVQSLEPQAADLPVFYAESGKEVVKAFQQALVYAISAITLISLLVLRNIRETVLVLIPLFVASVLTGAATVIFDNPFNFANIIALPLLLGLGIDSAIHVVFRMRNGQQNILRTSTARGVFFSSLTTAASFTSLAFIPHAGTASLGFLLTIGITLTLFCTLIILPAFAHREFKA